MNRRATKAASGARGASGKHAATQTDAQHLVNALVKLYEDNASTLTPDPLYTAFYYSHPPASQRIDRLLRHA